MKSKALPSKNRSYHSPLRERQALETRELILRALGEQMVASGPGDFSLQEIARRAGVAPRTIYRHFGSRGALLEALHAWVATRAFPEPPTTLQQLWDYPEKLFQAFDRHAPWIEASLQAGPSAELRAASRPQRVALVRQLLGDLTAGLKAEEVSMVCGLIKHLLSAEAWRCLRDDFGLDGRQAGLAVGWAMKTLAADLQGRGGPCGDRPGAPEEDEDAM